MSSEAIGCLCGLAVAVIAILAIEGALPVIYRGCKKIGLWWVSGQWRLPEQIEFRTAQGHVISGRPVGIRGFHLLVANERGQQMVSAGSAVDTGEFWRTWKHLGGDVTGWVDEEGNPFDPTE